MSPRLIVTAAAAMAAACLILHVPADASDTCQRASGGKCKTSQSAPNKPTSGAVTKKKTWNKRPSNAKGRDDYTAAQREKMMERARQICSKEFGKPSRVYRIDYKQGRVWCTPASY